MIVQKYEEKHRDVWNDFITGSKNATFLFNRSFMEYHAHRFEDFSLIIREGEKIIAVVPANIVGNTLNSHQGLTYGGIIFDTSVKLQKAISVFYYVLKFLSDSGISTFYFKLIPSFFCNYQTDDSEYILFLIEAELHTRNAALVIEYNNRIPYSGNIRREGMNAEKRGAYIKYNDEIEPFWSRVLTPNLQEKFGVLPVHSLEEMELLKQKFPDNIIQVNAYFNGRIAAGTTLFVDNNVVHCQYISSTNEGRKEGCLNYLFKTIVDHYSDRYQYFDFGIVNEKSGRYINSGMLFWKEAFGGRTRKQDSYRISTANNTKLVPYLS